jgi:hypothetical protein
MLRILRRHPLLTAIVGVALVSFLFVSGSTTFQICLDQDTYRYSGHAAKESPSGLFSVMIQYILNRWNCTGLFIDENDGGITAIATLLIAIFTITLWLTSRAQLRELNRQVLLQSEEFTATHSPKIIVRVVELAKFSRDEHAEWRIIVTNGGETDAIITDVGGVFLRVQIDKWISPEDRTFARLISPAIILAPGERQIFTGISEETWEVSAVMSVEDSLSYLYLIGEIHYCDRYMRKRQTGYIRRFDPESKRCLRVDDPDYEYQD